MKTTQKRIKVGAAVWLWLTISVVVVAHSLLSQLNNDFDFKSTQIFATTFIISLLMLLIFIVLDLVNTSFRKKVRRTEENSITLFFMQDLTIRKVIWVPIGVLGVFAVSFASTSADFVIIGIFLSGLIMMVAFFRTHSILVPIFIHGIYNTLVVLFRSGLIQGNIALQQTPFNVPDIGINFSGLTQLGSEILAQFTLVATAEELLKVLIIGFMVVAIKRGDFNTEGVSKWFAGIVAVAMWAILHLVQSV